MMQADVEMGYQSEAVPTGAEELHALVSHSQHTLRLSDNHYLVHWGADSQLWCVINMAGLDEHAESCHAFRNRQHCEHLDLISELCARERAQRC